MMIINYLADIICSVGNIYRRSVVVDAGAMRCKPHPSVTQARAMQEKFLKEETNCLCRLVTHLEEITHQILLCQQRFGTC